ncbi:DUF6883 domain-containing protein [Mixta calida]|uniref:DUF6883 domain-containing protein n=1 Tax=Mixta calida TaxID=665913 RepID=UPI0034D53A69
MSYCLPADLYYLPRDNLDPEKFELIMSPSHAWSRIDSEYVFDDTWSSGFQLINMQRRAFNGYTNQQPPHGPREREKLKSMVYSGEVVMLEKFSTSPGRLFYINDDGELICRDPLAFSFDGAQRVIDAWKNAVARRDYSCTGGKPRPTPVQPTAQQPAPLSIINSKVAGRLLAAGGIYNGNVEGFRQTAEQLGGDAPAGYGQVMDNKGLLIAGASVVAGLGMGRLNAISNINNSLNYSKFPALESPYLKGFTTESGTLLNAEHAVVDFKKLSAYALNPDHSIGGNKVRVFESALGYNLSNIDELVYKVRQGILNNSAAVLLHDNHGQRMSVDMPIVGINGKTATIRTGWIYETEALVPRMTTIYVKPQDNK